MFLHTASDQKLEGSPAVCFSILQAIKNWRRRRPGNEATVGDPENKVKIRPSLLLFRIVT